MKFRHTTTGELMFWCPGCDEPHCIKVDGSRGWKMTGVEPNITITPSILVTSGHYTRGHTGDCWCTWNSKHPDDPTDFKCEQCHSYVNNGSIQFLNDCTHALAGKTVPIPEWPNHGTDSVV